MTFTVFRTCDRSERSSTFVSVSFLFVSHEFYIETGDDEEPGDHDHDCWGLKCPPTNPAVYGEPFRSQVLRYTDGRITRAHGYHWHRDEPEADGTISKGYVCRQLHGGGDRRLRATHFDTASVWSCGQPVVVVQSDASQIRTARLDDTLIALDPDNRLFNRFSHEQTWSLLHFWHPGRYPPFGSDMVGVSQAMTKYGHYSGLQSPRSIHTYVAGGGTPSWLGSLVPTFFRNPNPQAPPSRGLGGMLTVLIGLMSLAACPRRRLTDDHPLMGGDLLTAAFAPLDGRHGVWHDHRWHGRHPLGCE